MVYAVDIRKNLVNRIALEHRYAFGDDRGDAVRDGLVELVVGGKNSDVMPLKKRGRLKVGGAPLQTEGFGFASQSDDAAVVIGENNNRLLPQRRLKNTLA
ncbi:hypothetical protein EVA_14531 [gut metagenome]|uniref:Uncharacterized protein n=1 Tax=gut metagenome TaxID=749906 RepID=J9G6D7_9ZZZZ